MDTPVIIFLPYSLMKRAGNDLVMPGTETDRREILDALSAENDQYLEEKDLTACAQRILEMIFTSNSYE